LSGDLLDLANDSLLGTHLGEVVHLVLLHVGKHVLGLTWDLPYGDVANFVKWGDLVVYGPTLVQFQGTCRFVEKDFLILADWLDYGRCLIWNLKLINNVVVAS
jgi:hypothetical protein